MQTWEQWRLHRQRRRSWHKSRTVTSYNPMPARLAVLVTIVFWVALLIYLLEVL